MNSEQSELERLRAENEALKAKVSKAPAPKEISFKVSEKGAVSVYGLQRFPVTLYQEQWLRILKESDRLRDFIEENQSNLAKRE